MIRVYTCRSDILQIIQIAALTAETQVCDAGFFQDADTAMGKGRGSLQGIDRRQLKNDIDTLIDSRSCSCPLVDNGRLPALYEIT